MGFLLLIIYFCHADVSCVTKKLFHVVAPDFLFQKPAAQKVHKNKLQGIVKFT